MSYRRLFGIVAKGALALASALPMLSVVVSAAPANAAAVSNASQLIYQGLHTYNWMGMAVDSDYIWVTEPYQGNVRVYRKSDRSLVTTINVGGSPQEVVLDGTYAWVGINNDVWSGTRAPSLVQIDQSTFSIVKNIRWDNGAMVLAGLTGLTQTSTDIYGAILGSGSAGGGTYVGGTVVDISKSTGTVVRTFTVGRSPSDLAIDNNSLWVVNNWDDSISQIDISSGTVTRSIYLGAIGGFQVSTRSNISLISDDGTHLWIIGENGSILELNASDGSTVATIPATYAGTTYYFLASVTTDSKYVWVSGAVGNGSTTGVLQINKTTGAIITAVGGLYNWATSMASDNTSVWLATDPYLAQIGIDYPTSPAVNTVAPAMTDTTVASRNLVGDSLSTTSGTWTGNNGSYTYQWYRCTSNSVSNPATSSSCTAISLATSTTYTLVNGDVGKYIVPVVTTTGTDTVSVSAAAAFSTAVVAPGPAVNTVAPVLSDQNGTTYDVGDQIMLDFGTWSNAKSFPMTMAFYSCTSNTIATPATSSSCTQLVTPYSNSYTTVSADKGNYIIGAVTRTGTDNSTTTAYSNWSLKIGASTAVVCAVSYVVCNMNFTFTDSTHATLNWTGPKGYPAGVITGYIVKVTYPGSPATTICTITSATTTKCDFTITNFANGMASFSVTPQMGASPMPGASVYTMLPSPMGVGGTVGSTGLALGWMGGGGIGAVVIDYTVNGKNCTETWGQGAAVSGISFANDCSTWTAGSNKAWLAQAESGWLLPNHTYTVTGSLTQSISLGSTDLNGNPTMPTSTPVSSAFSFTFKTLTVAPPRPSNVSAVDNGDGTYTITWTNPSGTLPSGGQAVGVSADGRETVFCGPTTMVAGTNSCTTYAPWNGTLADNDIPTSFYVYTYYDKTSTNLLSIIQGQPQQYNSGGMTYYSGVWGLSAGSWFDSNGNGSTVTVLSTPNDPTGVTATPSDGQITVTWTASSGSNSPTSYTVSVPGQTDCTVDLVANPSAPLSCTFTGLTNGTSYTATVVANNDSGSSTGATASATPASAPGAPTGVTATAGNGSASVSWTAPTNNGGSAITSYTVTSSPGGKTCTVNTPATTCTVSGLTNGTAYTFSVTATNVAGTSSASTASSAATPQATAPDAPTNVTATGDDGLANISWTAPVNDGGAPIDGYIVTANPGGATCTAVAPSTTCTISGLTNGTEYTFTVVATNNVGNSIASNPSNGVTPGAAASAPDYVQGTPSNHSVLINWKAPTTGPAPTSYTVTVSPGGQTCTIDLIANPSAALRCNFTGLTNGTPYTFTVTGTLANGNSSSDTITVVPNPGQFKPSAPRHVVFRGSVTGVATVTWLVSASNGGSAITKYVVYVNGTRFAKSCTVNMAANPSATLKCTFTGLKPKRFYNYRVAAVNAIGQTLSAKAKRAIDVNVRLVSFARNKYTMWQGLYRQAFITASYIKKFKYTKVVVTGYTNPGGPLSARTSFTQARALTVANYLTRQLRAMGVKGVTISATGTGASLYKHPNAAQRKLNRSVGTLLSYK